MTDKIISSKNSGLDQQKWFKKGWHEKQGDFFRWNIALIHFDTIISWNISNQTVIRINLSCFQWPRCRRNSQWGCEDVMGPRCSHGRSQKIGRWNPGASRRMFFSYHFPRPVYFFHDLNLWSHISILYIYICIHMYILYIYCKLCAHMIYHIWFHVMFHPSSSHAIGQPSSWNPDPNAYQSWWIWINLMIFDHNES